MRPSTVLVLLAVTTFASSCNQTDFPEAPPDQRPNPNTNPTPMPGGPAWGNPQASCVRDADCLLHEVCEAGVCQMQRCTQGPYNSLAPIGQQVEFYQDKELVVVDGSTFSGSYWVDGYSPASSRITYAGSYDGGATAVVDAAGGNFFGTRPDGIAVALAGRTTVTVMVGETRQTLTLSFVPIALAAGDVDADNRDELVALGATGQLAVCNVEASSCSNATLTGLPGGTVEGLDLAVGDIDGDHFAESVMLLVIGGQRQLYAYNSSADRAATGNARVVGSMITRGIGRIAAGDLDGDGRAEVVGHEDRGWFGWRDDALATYRVSSAGAGELGMVDGHGDTVDVAIADLDSDQIAEVVVLRTDGIVEVRSGRTGTLSSGWTATLVNTTSPTRLSLADYDGDSPMGRLVAGPDLVAGRAVPVMAMLFPPYDIEHSDGPATLSVGHSESMGTTRTDSVGLGLGVAVGYSASLGGFGAGLSAGLSRQIIASRSISRTLSVSNFLSIDPRPELYGYHYGAVVLAVGCFHSYTYALDDPTGRIGPDGGRFVIAVPVGGETTMWSTMRYNAMAAAVGLPRIDAPYRIGDPSSYPNTLVLPNGQPIPAADMVFPNPPTYLVSDVGSVAWWIDASNMVTNDVTQSTSLDLHGSLQIAGFSLSASASITRSSSYSVSLGQGVFVWGGLSAIPDNPATPEDEYALHSFTVRPYMYRQHYTDPSGRPAAFYVTGYAVGRR